MTISTVRQPTVHLLLLLVACLVVKSQRARSALRRSLRMDDNDEGTTIHCRYVRGDIRYENGETKDFDACDDGETLFDIAPEILSDINRTNDLHSGRTQLQIQGARKHSTADISSFDQIQASSSGTVSITADSSSL